MRIAALTIALALTAASAPAQEMTSGPVCLTNACVAGAAPGGKARKSFNENPRTVREAIDGGNGAATRRLGGAPAQVMNAFQQRLAIRIGNATNDGERANWQNQVTNHRNFADTSKGATLTFTDIPNRAGAILRREPGGATQYLLLNPDGGSTILPPGATP